MTDLSHEILEKYQVRKSKEQKSAFRQILLDAATANGCYAMIEKNGKADNIIIGNPNTARVIYTAHYDTPAATPFPNMMIPKNKLLYILYQTAICLLLYSLPILIMTLGSSLVYKYTSSDTLQMLVMLFGYSLIFVILILILKGPANIHNANDNTSGVLALLNIMATMTEEQKKNTALIFFDLEEQGCVGSKLWSKAHKNLIKSTPVINFDCIGVGDTILLAPRKDARHLKNKLEEAFTSNEAFTVEVAQKSTFSNSDHRNFPQGVGVAAFKTSKRGVLYTDKIHTKHDTECNEGNIDFIAECALKFAEIV